MLPQFNELYDGQTIFITGASGFVGKVLVEKILHALPGVKKIFVLIRESRGKSATERWNTITQSVLFNRIRDDCPSVLDKVVPVQGDITIDDLGLSPEDLEQVLNETTVVMHCAATIRFNDILRNAVELNIKGVNRMLEMCHRMENLKCLLHCSTCYVNVDKEDDIEEKVYPAACSPYKLMESLDWLDDAMLEGITNGIVPRYFNTYCFTKSVAEILVTEKAKDLPTVIFRPAIITGIWKDGIPGWADAFQGLSAQALGFGSGTIPRMPCNSANPLDGVPVDVVCNMMIACVAYRLNLQEQPATIPVFHCNSGDLNIFTIKTYVDLCGTLLNKFPLEKIIMSPTAGTHSTRKVESALHLAKHRGLGAVLDKFGALLGKKPFWLKTFGRVREMYEVFIPFVSKRWVYKSNGMLMLIENMQSEDIERFDFDIRKIDWNEYMTDFILGIKYFLLRDDIMNPKRLEIARRNVILHNTIELVLATIVSYIFIVILTGSFGSWSLAVPICVYLFYHYHMAGYTEIERVGDVDGYIKRIKVAARGKLNNTSYKC